MSGNIPKKYNGHPILEYIHFHFTGLFLLLYFIFPFVWYIDYTFTKTQTILTGEIPATICNATNLWILVLSNNGLSGSLRQCLGNLSDKMHCIDLANNQFRGSIPTTFSSESCQLRYLNMYDNQLEGLLPRSLSNCKHIGNNKMGGTFPSWLFTLGELEVLVLRSNRLYGPVSGRSTSHPFPKLRILDLSNNQFTGYLPIQYFKNMKPAA